MCWAGVVWSATLRARVQGSSPSATPPEGGKALAMTDGRVRMARRITSRWALVRSTGLLAFVVQLLSCASARSPPARWSPPRPGGMSASHGGMWTSGHAPPRAPATPAFARVTFIGVVSALSKVDGSHWDIGGSVSSEDVQKVALALGAGDPYAAVLGVIGGLAIPALQKPDIGGSAALWTSAGGGQSFELAKHQDSYTPQWNVTWSHVPLDGTARIRVILRDLDVQFDDSMGTFEIGPADIRSAILHQRVYAARVDGQTGGQLLLAAISAIPEVGP